MPKNKVKFNLNNVHFAKLTIASDNTYTFATPKRWPGAVSLSLDANGEPENFYADGYAYYVLNNNMGYEGDYESALIPEDFRTDHLGEYADDNGVIIESTAGELTPFALLFEFDGDQKHIRHVLYNCSASRPTIASKTNEEKREVQTEKIKIKANPLPDGLVKAKSGDDTTTEVYNGWYAGVYIPDTTVEDTTLSALTIGSLTLAPTFAAGTTEYTTETTATTATVTATATDNDAAVAITINGSSIASGGTATWQSGKNTVLITVTNGTYSKTYKVEVTKS